MAIWYAYEDEGNFSYPSVTEFVHATNNAAQINANAMIPSSPVYFEFLCNDNPANQMCVGIIQTAYSGGNVRNNYGSSHGCAWVAENGAVFNDANYQGYSLPGGWSTGTTIGVYATSTQIAFTQDGFTWNGSYSTAQIVAGTGLITYGYSGPVVPFVSIAGSVADWTLNASVGTCNFALPIGASYLSLPSIAVSKQVQYTVYDVNNAVAKQVQFVARQPIEAVSKQIQYVAREPLGAVTKQVQYLIVQQLPNVPQAGSIMIIS